MKMILNATAHFTNLSAAINYYRTYGYNRKDVREKIDAGAILIGPPKIGPNEKLKINIEGRYVIASY